MISEHAHAAKLIRKEIKSHGIKATVRAETASMTSSVNVYLENELPATVAAIEEFATKFQYGHFDGMTDSYEYSNKKEELPQVKFVFVNVSFTDSMKQAAWTHLRKWHISLIDAPELYKDATNENFDGEWGSTWVHRALNGSMECGFWNSYKPRVSS